jgi:hypothetical protein
MMAHEKDIANSRKMREARATFTMWHLGSLESGKDAVVMVAGVELPAICD